MYQTRHSLIFSVSKEECLAELKAFKQTNDDSSTKNSLFFI